MLDKTPLTSARYQGLVRRAAVYQAWVDSHQVGLPDALAMLDADARQVNVRLEPAAFLCPPRALSRGTGRNRPADTGRGLRALAQPLETGTLQARH